jgi:Response regulator containing a CheY-like receiver domain and a GGDEF domain
MQRVLIVDDSKTAQIRLRKMLTQYDIIVDVSFSAEEALGYLSYRHPAVIFMDHHMEGMDGFEALKIIKANPKTAMIPVIMYTAQKGDVYVGQARALGALDILSKEAIKPSNLQRVLSSLKILPKDNAEKSTKSTKTAATENPAAIAQVSPPVVAEPKPTPEDTAQEQVATQVARLFKMHIAEMRQQIAENSRFVVRRLGEEIVKNSSKEPTIGDVPLSVVNAEIDADQRKSSFISSSLLVLIFIGLALIAYEIFQTKGEMKGLQQDYGELVKLNNENVKLLNTYASRRAPPPTLAPQRVAPALLDALSWALDIDLEFPWRAAPLNEQQMLKISNLVYRLSSVGFNGAIELDIHSGNYCLQQSAEGTLVLADPTLPTTKCVFSADVTTEYSRDSYLSLPYLNFEQNALPVQEGIIDLNVVTSGNDSPRYDYPRVAPELTADIWNDVAQKNNRISVSFDFL